MVLDACALIALQFREPGHELVRESIASGGCLIHAVNLAEVYYGLLQNPAYSIETIDQILAKHRRMGMEVSEDLSPAIWRGAATFRASVSRIAFADCFAVALAQSLNCPVLTSDRREFDRPEVLTRCQVMFIR
jgi:PIN domain nuclease of toxin-antitoxin system